MGVAGQGLGQMSIQSVAQKACLSLSHRGFMRREARIGPGLTHGDEIVVKTPICIVSAGYTSILFKTTSPNPSYIQTILSASVASFVSKCQAVEQTHFILAPSLGGQVFGRNDISFTDGKFEA